LLLRCFNLCEKITRYLFNVAAGWLRPSLVLLEKNENLNKLKYDRRIKKPRLEQENAAVFLPIVKIDEAEVVYQSENFNDDYIDLVHEEEAEVDPLLGYE